MFFIMYFISYQTVVFIYIGKVTELVDTSVLLKPISEFNYGNVILSIWYIANIFFKTSFAGSESSEATLHSNNSISLRTGRGLALDSSAWLRHPLLVRDVPILGEMMPLWSQQRASADGEADGHEDDDLGSLTNFMSQRYMLSGDERNPHRTLSREIWVRKGLKF